MTNPTPDSELMSLQMLLASKRNEIPADTEVNRFLIELHRRQRAQLLTKKPSLLEQAREWFGSLSRPQLAYGIAGSFACAAIFAVTLLGGRHDGGSTSTASVTTSKPSVLSAAVTDVIWQPLHPAHSVLASVFNSGRSMEELTMPKVNSALSFAETRFHPTAPRFVLTNSRVAYDSQASF